MNDVVRAQRSKWDAVSAEITAFVSDPGSAGIGVGVQYFPKTAAGFPASCPTHAQCGAGGVCFLSACAIRGQILPCISALDCGPVAWVPIGVCQYDHNALCSAGMACRNDFNGFPHGACQALTTSTCLGSDDCVAADFATPAVALAPLPGVAPAVIAFLGSHGPNGATPTPAALQGAVDNARTYAMSHAGHTVVVVLATDGAPNEVLDPANGVCGAAASQQAIDAEVARIANAGLVGTPSIKTFAIGVFTPSDAPTGTVALNQIATEGGTTAPFIIDVSGTASNLEQKFGAALNMIRRTALPCQYQIPTPAMGRPDFFKLNVHYTGGSGTDLIVPYVGKSGGS